MPHHDTFGTPCGAGSINDITSILRRWTDGQLSDGVVLADVVYAHAGEGISGKRRNKAALRGHQHRLNLLENHAATHLREFRVERHISRAAPENGKKSRQKIDRPLKQHGNVFTPTHALRGKKRGEPTNAFIQFAIGQAGISELHGRGGRSLGHLLLEPMHQGGTTTLPSGNKRRTRRLSGQGVIYFARNMRCIQGRQYGVMRSGNPMETDSAARHSFPEETRTFFFEGVDEARGDAAIRPRGTIRPRAGEKDDHFTFVRGRPIARVEKVPRVSLPTHFFGVVGFGLALRARDEIPQSSQRSGQIVADLRPRNLAQFADMPKCSARQIGNFRQTVKIPRNVGGSRGVEENKKRHLLTGLPEFLSHGIGNPSSEGVAGQVVGTFRLQRADLSGVVRGHLLHRFVRRNPPGQFRRLQTVNRTPLLHGAD